MSENILYQSLEKLQTIVNVCGMNFYITWENDNEGYDQKGVKWINKSSPECTNQKLIDACLDGFNKINNWIDAQQNSR